MFLKKIRKGKKNNEIRGVTFHPKIKKYKNSNKTSQPCQSKPKIYYIPI